MQRFLGTCELLTALDPQEVRALSDWVVAIPLEDWGQQEVHGKPLKPAMMSNRTWFNFGPTFDPLVNKILAEFFPGCIPQQAMLSVVMPGHDIPPHVDHQCPEWICRVHVPLTSVKEAVMIMDDGEHCMEVGNAYKINTEARHAVRNTGSEPRIHFMFDVRTV